MNLKPIAPKLQLGKVDFINDIQVVRADTLIYPLVYSANGTHTLYSLPTNDAHKPYTKRKDVNLDELVDKTLVLKHWSIYKKNDKVYGIIKDNQFVVQ